MLTDRQIRRIVLKIREDLNDRRGLHLDSVDRETQVEILKAWSAIVRGVANTTTAPAPAVTAEEAIGKLDEAIQLSVALADLLTVRDGLSLVAKANSVPIVLHDAKEMLAALVRTQAEKLARYEETMANASDVARGHEPNNGWGSRTVISDAWADGFRTACVEISDKLLAPEQGKEG